MVRNVSLDSLKLLMAFMVVGVHAGFLQEISSLGYYLTVNGLFRVAVPVFLVINGFYFFPVVAKGSQVSWLKRVFVLYSVWMLFYAYFWFSLPDMSLRSVASMVKQIAVGYHHLWYVSAMLGAALILLLFKRFSTRFLVGTILVFYIVGVLIQYLGNYHYFEGNVLDVLFNKYSVHRNALFFSYPFFCIGYLIHKYKLHERFTVSRSGMLCAAGLLLLLFESCFNYLQEGRSGGFDNYLSLIIVSPLIFIYFTRIDIAGNSKNIALYASAIYFIHSFFWTVFRKNTELEPTMLTFACLLASAASSYFLIKINNKVKCIL